MNDHELNIAVGFAQEIPGGFVFEIGNGWLHRRVHCIQGRIGTTSLANAVNVEEYLEETVAEFGVTIVGEGQNVELDSNDFKVDGYETPDWSDDLKTIEIKLSTELNDIVLPLSVFYQARASENFIKKWIKIHPCELENWAVKSVIIEHMRFKEMVEGISPFSRYSKTYPNHEDDVHFSPDKANTERPEKRFEFGDMARAVVSYWGYNEGLFFFTESLTGEEVFHRPTGLVMKHNDYAPLTNGMTTGAAVIGGYAGASELGFKRYTEYLMKNWCVMGAKSVPVAWSTWLVKLTEYDRMALLGIIKRLKDAGFYEALHLDLGWEAQAPLKVNSARFPHGIKEIVRRASEAGLDMSYWVNPFSCNYWLPETAKEHPEYVVPGKVSPRSNANALCVLSEYSDYVKKRFVDLVTEMNARMIVWDGNDWNIPNCTARNHAHKSQTELEINARKKLAEICAAAHDAREDLIISAFSLPMDNHRLCALDQEQISDTHEFPIIQAELIQRQQLFQMTWEHPFRTIRGSWYGVGWHESGDLAQHSMDELKHAVMSMIANGAAQSGGSVDLSSASPEFVEFLTKFYAFRKRFEKYFNTYQHILGFPDGENIDGSGHIVDGVGFIALINPTRSEKTMRIPLDSAELELSREKKYNLTDWSGLEHGNSLGVAKFDSPITIEIGPLEVKYIGVNV
ncbi:MAG: alpha-galactosidase [Armatimonadetes bacterium]|nr:alpha-galactosidase [Armatimonadota bacterium]